jgi:hypothetical protein
VVADQLLRTPSVARGEWIDPRSACLICKPHLEEHTGPGIPLFHPGVLHRSDCPLVPRLSPERVAEYNRFCDEVRECERRAWEKASTYVIGASP